MVVKLSHVVECEVWNLWHRTYTVFRECGSVELNVLRDESVTDREEGGVVVWLMMETKVVPTLDQVEQLLQFLGNYEE